MFWVLGLLTLISSVKEGRCRDNGREGLAEVSFA